MYPAIETAFTEHIWHQSCRADKAKGFFNISCKISGGKQYDSDDFRVGRFYDFPALYVS
jgi:hypothetical protein